MATIALDIISWGTDGFFKRALAKVEEARAKEARKHVRSYLRNLNDDQLSALSLTREEVSELRVD